MKMRLIKYIMDAIWTGLWSRLAQIGIGDPLNQLVYVAPYKIAPPRYTYKPRKVKAYRRNYRLEEKIRHDEDLK